MFDRKGPSMIAVTIMTNAKSSAQRRTRWKITYAEQQANGCYAIKYKATNTCVYFLFRKFNQTDRSHDLCDRIARHLHSATNLDQVELNCHDI